jgi:hypothetical protein
VERVEIDEPLVYPVLEGMPNRPVPPMGDPADY